MATKKTSTPANRKSGKSQLASKRVPRSRSAKTMTAGSSPSGPIIVGIAGSAGSLSALQSFFSALPADTGMAFVVVTHLSPEHESHLASLLQAHTKMPVTQVNKKLPVRANHVYVVPPAKNILIADAHVDVAEFEEPRSKRTPVDFFFRTLARSHRDAVAIILSGGGTDGSVGVKDVKEEGGLLMVQDPEESEYASMPNAAISTGLADIVLPARELAARLEQYARQSPRLPVEAERLDDREWALVQGILEQVQRRTKHDFSEYKRSTILRRVRRRMLLNSHPTLESYLEYMHMHPAESFALLNDLLIGVTNFFRDHEAWDALGKQVIPQIFKHKDMSETIRIWSVGCASGEEAYSLVILFLEAAAELGENRTIQIFASDIDEDSLARSREGLYPAAIEADVNPERLERFFTRQGNHYQVRRELRDMILFTPHSVLRDPPFSRLDLVSCRNLLIYLQRDIQQYVLDVFHYSLIPGGYLFLGGSESTAGKEAYFQTLDKTHRIYQSLPWQAHEAHIPTLPPAARPSDRARMPALPRPSLPRPPSEPFLLEDQHRRSLESFGPPSIMVDGDYRILHVSETAGRYLSQPKGPLTSDLLKLVRPELQGELRSALFQALERRRPNITAPVVLELDGVRRRVSVSVHPRTEPSPSGPAANRQALVVFLEDESLPEAGRQPSEGLEAPQSGARAVQLELEVGRLRDQLQSTQEEYDSSTEEMKAANEELQSINEEYHLTTEELETSKEELEAVNEELQTVNNELKAKLEEVSRAHRDLENVMGAMEIATLFLDRSLRIQRYTPALSEFFNILRTDIGRPIDHLSHNLGNYSRLTQDAQQVLNTLQPLDREVRGPNGAWYLIRLRPYRTVEDVIEGVVITFVDISDLKGAEEALRQANETLEERVQERTAALAEAGRKLEQTGQMFSMLFHVNPIPTSLTRLEDGLFIDINEAYSGFFGISRDEVLGHTSNELNLPIQGPERRAEVVARLRSEGILRSLEMEVSLHNGETRTVLASLQHLMLDGNDAILGTFIDITGRVLAERQIRRLAADLTAAEQRERQRISQILHDDLQQRLFAVKMQLSFLQQAYQEGGTERVRADTKELDDSLAESIETARRLSVDLSPLIVQGENLGDAVSWLADEMRSRYGLETDVNVKPPLPRLDDDLRLLLFHTIRELLFNVVKHGEILHASVAMEQVDQRLRITVHDDGKGFDGDAVMADPKLAHGLLRLRSRLALLGCEMKVDSKPGDGTSVVIDAPVQAGTT